MAAGWVPGRWPAGWPAASLDRLLASALEEDLGSGDVTTLAVVDEGLAARAVFWAKASGVVAGLPVAARVLALVDPEVVFAPLVAEGAAVGPGTALARAEGRAASLLQAERVALNFLQRLSGVATLTARFVAAAGGRAEILDTRKTTPGLRWLERYAVRLGGGRNHRFGLSDGILIKDNHVRAAGGVAAAVRRARARGPRGLRIEVECTTLEEVDAALQAGADIVLLDNMTPPLLAEAVARVAGRARTEASGGVTLDNVAAVAATGVDAISVGALTHSAPALDISLEFEVEPRVDAPGTRG
jgi:nicotinate-nucleotide pyrophosphorylase (carboxylating)